MQTHVHDRLARLLDALERRTPEERRERVQTEVVETDGDWIVPRTEGPAALVEIRLHEVSGHGRSLDAAIADWMTRARAAGTVTS